MSTNARSAPSIGRFGGGGGGDDPDDPHAGLGDAQRAQLEYEAKRQKRAEWARKLLERRIEDFKASPEGVLLNAAEANDTDALLTALARDPDLEVQTDSSHQYPGYTALHFAAHHGNVEMVLALLMSGAKLGVCEKFGYTPLHVSVISDQRVRRHHPRAVLYFVWDAWCSEGELVCCRLKAS
jgi:hypothetical protein